MATGAPSSGAVLNFARALRAGPRGRKSVPYRDLLGSMKLFGFFLAVLSVVLELRHHDRALGPVLMPAALFFMLLALLESPGGVVRRPEPRPQGCDLRAARHAQHARVRGVRGVVRPLDPLPDGRPCAEVAHALGARDAPPDALVSRTREPHVAGTRDHRARDGARSSASSGPRASGRREHPHWALDPKIFFALGTLFFYLFVLVRARRGAAPGSRRRVSRWSGFVLVFLSYTAVNMFVSKLHVFRS